MSARTDLRYLSRDPLPAWGRWPRPLGQISTGAVRTQHAPSRTARSAGPETPHPITARALGCVIGAAFALPPAAEPVAGADGALEVILGLGVSLAFVGIVFRAFARHRPSRRAPHDQPDADYGAARPVPPAIEPAALGAADVKGRRQVTVGHPPEPEQARLGPETLAPLARVLDTSRRLNAAEARVAVELAALPDGFWLVECGVLIEGRRIPFLVMGATGVFLVCPSDGAWTLHDLGIMSALADDVRARLPGYDGHPHAVVCLAFDVMRPREWFGGRHLSGRGGWVLGADWLLRWMFAFGPDHGLRNGDIRRLDEASGPLWGRRSTARLPAGVNHG